MIRRNLLVLAATAIVTIAGPAAGQDTDQCRPMTLASDDAGRAIRHIDVHGDGASHGDMRIGTRRLLDEAGNEVGHRRWIGIALNAPPGEEERSEILTNIVFKLGDGQLHVQTFIDAGRPVDTTDASVLTGDAPATGVVIGGTGAYEFARGSYASYRDGEKRIYKFNIKRD